MSWSESAITKEINKKGYQVYEILLPVKGWPRGYNNNVFRAVVYADNGALVEIDLGWKSVEQCLQFIHCNTFDEIVKSKAGKVISQEYLFEDKIEDFF